MLDVEKVLIARVPVAGSAYGRGMKLSDWAEDHARVLLSPLGRRWSHVQAVASAARVLAQQLDRDDGEALVASAYFHDVGYARGLVASGFHPLDGARHLLALDQIRLAGLVAHHTGAKHEAKLRGLEDEVASFEDERSIVSAALAYCDLTTGPDGELVTPRQRLADVEARYGKGNPVTDGLRAAWPELMAAIGAIEALRDEGVDASTSSPDVGLCSVVEEVLDS